MLTAGYASIRFAARLAKEPNMNSITAAVDDIANMPRQRCVNLGGSKEVKTCFFGDLSSKTNIVLFGDSHAIQWFNPLLAAAESHGWKLTTIVASGCPATDVDVRPRGTSAMFTSSCSLWRSASIQSIVAQRPSLVFIANAVIYLRRPGKQAGPFDVSLNQWREGMRHTVEALSSARIQVVIMRDNPISDFDIPTCLARSMRHSWYPGGTCEMDRSTSLNPAVFEAEKESVSGLPNVHFIDLTDRLCRTDVCWSVQQGLVMYRDDNHLTGRFAASLAPELEEQLLPLLRTATRSGERVSG
jgi:hypothetical protein